MKKAVIAIVNFNDKILVGKKRSDSSSFLSGLWHIPGESLEEGENDYDALTRGMIEEAGLKIRVGKLIGSNETPNRFANWYECFCDDDKINVGSDLEDARFIPKEEVMDFIGERTLEYWPKEVLEYFKL